MLTQQADKPHNSVPAPLTVLKASFGNVGFVICTIMLIAFAAIFQFITYRKGIVITKLPVPLRSPLDRMDKSKLAPYKFLKSETIASEVVDELGTEEYIQWSLQDTSAEVANKPESLIHLFVTYYTGTPDQVPHVPEVCYLGSGYKVKDSEYIEIPIPSLGEDFSIQMQVLEFDKSTLLGQESRVVMYTFNANGQFAAGPYAVRSIIGNPSVKHAYFSKLELTFGNREAMPNKEKSIEAGKRFLQTVVPVLVREHWPDWEAVLAEEKMQDSSSEVAKSNSLKSKGDS